MKTRQMNCIAIEPDNYYQVWFHRSKYLYANSANQRDQLIADESNPVFERQYAHEASAK